MDSQSRSSQVAGDGLNGASRHSRPRPPVSGTASPRSATSRTSSAQQLHDAVQDEYTSQDTPNRYVKTPVPDGSTSGRLFHPEASLVLVGIRASGKRSLGLIAATALGRRFVTEDHYFQTLNGLSRQDYLKIHGSEQFHRQDIETSKRMLEDNKYRCVIDCGLGSLTSGLQEYLRLFSRTNPVVFVLRDMDQIKAILNLDDRAAKLLEQGNFTHRKCSNFEFYNLEDDSMHGSADTEMADRASPNYSFKLRSAQAEFSSFVRFITGCSLTEPTLLSPFSLDGPVELRSYTHALLIRASDFADGRVDFGALEAAGDVLEIYVDQWQSNTTRVLSKMVATARRTLAIPILMSASRGLSESQTMETYMAVLLQGLRLGVQFISVDLDLDTSQIDRLRAVKGYTKLIGNYTNYVSKENGWKDIKLRNSYNRALDLKFDMVRLLNVPTSRQDNDAAIWFAEQLKDIPGPRLIAIIYNVGFLGRTSQIMNPVLTRVTHPSLPEGKSGREYSFRPLLSSRQIVSALFDSYVFDSLQFYIVGANVSASLSPAMHNAAYNLLGLKHRYSTKPINTWEDIEILARDDALGGLSVVQPYKVKLVPHMHALSGNAKAIGAVNTLIPLRQQAAGLTPSLDIQAQLRNRAGKIIGWFGDNTDFIGIMNCVSRSLSPRNAIQPKTTSLVIGAGGMARAAVYAMLQIGCKHIFVYNRTVSNTRALARHFNDWARSQTTGLVSANVQEPVKVIERTSDPWPPEFAPPTIVVSCVTHELLDGNPGADFEMPEQWMQSPSGGVVVEMAYMTKETPLIRQIKRFRASTQRPWVLIDGIEALIEQAVGQFESMTGRKAPKRCMAEAAHASIQKNTSYLIDGEEFFT
ncbi:Shikimate dehydrogenase substrate binding domain-containing protein [Cladophialophora immunda]|nr:Shikimate dehydrogenase substrate binding domain-containing protein [Cladophialophora immunda]